VCIQKEGGYSIILEPAGEGSEGGRELEEEIGRELQCFISTVLHCGFSI
jgi:hypothetical protein